MSLAAINPVLLVVLVVGGLLAFSRKKPVAAGFAAFVVLLYFAVSESAFLVLGTILLMIVLSVPIYVTIAILTISCFYFLTSEPAYQRFESYTLIIEKIFRLTDQNVLLAIPYFVVAGSVMCAGGIARRIIDFADALVGWLPGGLAAAAVLSCMFFAAISGSSPVTVIAIGSIMVPALVKYGYDEKFAVGLLTSSGSLGILIPPSIPMIIYAIMVAGTMSVNVADLFIAGVFPGLVIGGLLVAYSVYHGATRPGFSWRALRPPSLHTIVQKFVEGFWALLLPVLILGGIYPLFGPTGLFTATEAAAVAVVYAFVVEIFVHRELTLRKVPGLLWESTIMMGSLLVIMIMSIALNHYLVDQQIPDAAAAWVTSLDLTPATFLLVLNVFLLLVGCLMDIMSAIMIIAPLLAPVAAGFGINPIHLGIIFIVNLEIGYLTPPIGLNLFVSSTLFKKEIGYVMRAVLAPIAIMGFGLALITWVEPLSGGLPRMLAGRPFLGEIAAEVKPGPDGEGTKTSTAAAGGTGEVKSLQELMREAAERRKREQEGQQ